MIEYKKNNKDSNIKDDTTRHLIISSNLYVKSLEHDIELNKFNVYGKFVGNDIDLCNYYSKKYY